MASPNQNAAGSAQASLKVSVFFTFDCNQDIYLNQLTPFRLHVLLTLFACMTLFDGYDGICILKLECHGLKIPPYLGISFISPFGHWLRLVGFLW